tara:strand:+ start:365 stop:586 length:222 start_codon:yes stop_codon:yes gene_type:complete
LKYKLDIDSLLTPSSKILYNNNINKDKEFKMEDIKTALVLSPDVTIPDVVRMIKQRQQELEQQPPAMEIMENK